MVMFAGAPVSGSLPRLLRRGGSRRILSTGESAGRSRRAQAR